MNDKGLENLMIAIYVQAVRDIKKFKKIGINGTGSNYISKRNYESAIKWIESPYMQYFNDDTVNYIKEKVLKNG